MTIYSGTQSVKSDRKLVLRLPKLSPGYQNLDIIPTIQSNNLERRLEAKSLVTTTETEDKVESRLLLDVVVRESTAVLELLTGEDKTLLIGGNALLVLDLGLDVVNGVGGLDIEGDGLAGQGLHKNLHDWMCG